ncbi:MAG TPA: TIGR02266 family protein [Myxococcota bacterium]|jgi:uncharacterized protein (TIGR02266 family)|nr:TIGR02266 family protein [Myxococcota bacterium]
MSEERPSAPPPPGDGPDRRSEERGTLMLRVDYADGREFLHDYTENLSRGGAFVATARRFAVGDKVSVVLSFPGLLAPLKLTGDVRWLRPEATAEGEAGVGVQFSLAAEGLSRLARLVERVRAGDRAVLSEVRRYRVLMVEDNEHVRFLLREGLRAVAERQRQLKVAFEFEEVSNGEEALRLLLEPGHKSFDVVVVDLYLPVMDGHALIRALRASEEHRHTPLLCVSAGGDAELGKAREAGADLCLAKPLQIRTFFETVTKLLRRRADVDPRDDPDSFADEG